MAGVELGTAFISLTVEASKVSGEVRKSLGDLSSAADAEGKTAGSRFSSSFGGSIKKLGGLIAGAFAVQGVTSFFGDAISEANEAREVTARTANVLQSMGNVAGVSASQVADLAGALSNKSAVDDEVIQSGQNMLLTFSNIRDEAGKGNDIFSQTSGLMVDMSVAMGQDMQSSAVQLGKALNDPIKGVSALSRVGVSFTEQQKTQIKTLTESGDVLGAQKIILGEVKKQFGGAAEAMASPAERAAVAWGNFKETVGTAIMPAVDLVLGGLATMALQASDLISSIDFSAIGDSIAAFAQADLFGAFLDSIKGVGTAIGELAGTAAPILGGIVKALAPLAKVAIGGGIIALTGAFTVLAGVIGAVSPVISAIVDVLSDPIFQIVAAAIGGVLVAAFWSAIAATIALNAQMALLIAQTTIAAAATKVAAAAQKAWSVAMAIFNAITSANPIAIIIIAIVALIAIIAVIVAKTIGWGNVWKKFQAIVLGVWNGIKAAAAAIWNAIVDVVTGAVSGIAAIITAYINIWRTIITSSFNAIKTVIGAAWNGIKAVTGAVFGAITGLIRGYINIWRTVIVTGIRVIRTVITAAWNAIKAVTVAVWNAIKSLIVAQINAIRTAVNAGINAVKGVVTAGWNAIKAATSAAWDGIKGAVSAGVSAVIGLVSGLPGQIQGVFAGAAGWLVSAGSQIIQGLLNGIESMIGAVKSKLASLTNLIPDLKGPPKKDKELLRKNGQLIMRGLVDGLGDGTPKLVKALRQVTDQIGGAVGIGRALKGGPEAIKKILERMRAEVKGSDFAKQLTPSVAELGIMLNQQLHPKQFAKLAKGFSKDLPAAIKKGISGIDAFLDGMAGKIGKALGDDKITRAQAASLTSVTDRYKAQLGTLKALRAEWDKQTQKLADMKQAAADLASSVADSIKGELDLSKAISDQQSGVSQVVGAYQAGFQGADSTQGTTAGGVTFESVSGVVKGLASRALAFASKLRALAAAGIPGGLIREVAGLGSEQGIKVADALLSGSREQVAQLAIDYNAIQSASQDVGAAVSDAFYGAGIQAQQGLLDGMLQPAQIEETAKALARTLTKALKRALGIKSPSKLLADQIGGPMAAGLGQGYLAGLSTIEKSVNNATRSLVDVPSLAVGDTTATGTPGAGAAGMQVRVFIGETELTDIVRTEVDRGGIRQARQLAHGRRRA